MPHRWLYLCLAFLLAVGNVTGLRAAYSYSPGGVANTISAGGGTASIAYNSSTNVYTVTYTYRGGASNTRTISGSPAQDYGVVFVDRVSGNGVNPTTAGTRIATYSGFNIVNGGGTFTGSYTPGEWLTLGVRTATDCTNNSFDDTVDTVVWTQAGVTSGPQPFWHHMRFTNSSAVPVTYDVIRNRAGGTTTIDTVTVPALTFGSLVKTYEMQDGDTFSLAATLKDYVFQNGTWLSLPDAVTTFQPVNQNGDTYSQADLDAMSGTGTASTGVKLPAVSGSSPPAPPAATSSNSIPINTPSYLPTSVPTAGAGSTWPTSTGNTTDSERLDKATYRQGIDKLDTKLAQQLEQQKKTNEHLEKQAEVASMTKTAKAEGETAKAEMAGKGGTAKSDAEGAFAGVPVAEAKTASTSAPDWTFTNDLIGTINADPFASGRFSGIASWFRAAFSWLLGILLVTLIAQHAAEAIKGVGNAQQARGNPVVAGTGAQATALVAAGLMTVIILAGVVSIIALAVSDFGFGTITGLFSTNPYSGMSGGVAYLLDKFFNLGHITLYLCARPLVPLAFAKIQAGVMAAVRFVVP